jgi:5-methylcytosine-specific restriction protein B
MDTNEPVLRILYGPPGTGKTWQAAREAVRIISPDVAEDQIAVRHRALVKSEEIIWVTFHPSYTYEDFVEGFRPVRTEAGLMYEPRPGPFRKACGSTNNAQDLIEYFRVDQVIESSTKAQYVVESYDRGCVVLRNIKGKGEGLLTPVSLEVVHRLITAGKYVPGDLSLPGDQHPRKKEISADVGFDMQTLFGMTGPLRAVWEYLDGRAQVKPPDAKPTVLVIDEINRADLSRVFGELITLLEPDKRIDAKEERLVWLPYSQELFGVPKNLHLIATMNTADRSLAVMDHALRRRFEFIEVPPVPSLCASPYGGLDLSNVLTVWNRAITALLSRDKQIGHAYLHRDRLERVRCSHGFSDDHDGQLKAVSAVIRDAVLPLLLEYFRGDWRKVDLVFGRNYATAKGGLLQAVAFDDIAVRADDLADLTDAADFTLQAFWDPSSPNWDADRFRVALLVAPL